MLLPGTPVLYYGDEINMVDGTSSSTSPGQRGQPMRTIMQWENATNAGFQSCNDSCTAPWFDINDYSTNNVMVSIVSLG